MVGQANNNDSQAAGGNAGMDQPFSPTTDPAGPPARSGEDMHRGWVKLWRKWRDHEMASDANATLVFLHLLTEARRSPKRNRRYGYTLERGQCDLTLGQLAKLTALSVKSVRGALDRLERYETITRGTQQGRQPAIITIVNFDRYNPDAPQGGNQPSDQRATIGQLPEKGETVKKLSTPALAVGFDEFYSKYPRKKDRVAAKKAWAKLNVEERARALDAVVAFAAAVAEWPAGERQFVKHPATWLNKGAYDDDRAEWAPSGKATVKPSDKVSEEYRR